MNDRLVEMKRYKQELCNQVSNCDDSTFQSVVRVVSERLKAESREGLVQKLEAKDVVVAERRPSGQKVFFVGG